MDKNLEEFKLKLTELLSEYGVTLVPDLAVKIVPAPKPEVKKEDEKETKQAE